MKSMPVPVIMYHSVGTNKNGILDLRLACPWKLFQKQLEQLKTMNMETISLQQLYDYRKYGKNIPSKAIILTFDDGYLDNWIFAYPLLKKYGFKGTIFVNPEFADSRNIVRKNLEDVWNGDAAFENLESFGFLSWEEMKIMEAEGIFDIQSHAMSHTWYFSSDEIIDFHHPGNNRYPWLFWNAAPEKKSCYLTENQEAYVPYGTPIYRYGKSLETRKYFQDKDLDRSLAEFVKKEGNSFFSRKGWKEELFCQAELYKSTNAVKGRYETDEEQLERFKYELFKSKRILEDKLHKKVNYLCWPGGAYNNTALQIAEEVGYLSTTLLYRDLNIKNTLGEDPSIINRIGSSDSFIRRNRFIVYADPGFYTANIKYFQGMKIYLWVIRLYKIKYLINFFIKDKIGGKK